MIYKRALIYLAVILFVISCSEKGDVIDLVKFEARNGLIGFKHKEGGVAIEPKYIFAYEFTPDGLAAVVEEEGHWTRINIKGYTVESPYVVNNAPDQYHEGLARFISGDNMKVGFSDQKGNAIIPPKYDWASKFKHGKSIVCTRCFLDLESEEPNYIEGEWGVIDKKGTVIVPMTHQKQEIYQRLDIRH